MEKIMLITELPSGFSYYLEVTIIPFYAYLYQYGAYGGEVSI